MRKVIWGIIALVIVVGLILLARGDRDEGGLTEGPESEGPPLTSMTDGDNTVAVSDKVAQGDVVSIDLAILTNSGYVVVHEDSDGAPGSDLGHSALLIGTNENVSVTLNRPAETGETLHAMLHTDDGDGVYEFPGPDTPLRNSGGDILVVPFMVTGNTDTAPGADRTDSDTEQDSSDESSQDNETSGGINQAEISYTDSGFSPSTLTVSSGTTVVFRNNSSSNFWPASAQHPTHTVYPGSGIQQCGTAEASQIFDACTPVAPGGSYSFTFTETGAWGYHNHLQASHFGRITVE